MIWQLSNWFLYGNPNTDGLFYRTYYNEYGNEKYSNWTKYSLNTAFNINTLSQTRTGEKKFYGIQFANINPGNFSLSDYLQFEIQSSDTAPIECVGNIQSMNNFNTWCTDYCYEHLFYGCSKLKYGPALPSLKLAPYCYNNMFYNCSNLETLDSTNQYTILNVYSSILPAAVGNANGCYQNMFANCVKFNPLVPQLMILPSLQLATNCYYHMFYNCTSLITAPALPATTLAPYCYYQMFSYCTFLENAPALPATQLFEYCYYGMFNNCQSLVKAPELPAAELAYKCYEHIFMSCQSLNEIKVGFTQWSDSTFEWVKGVSVTGSFIRSSKDLEIVYGISNIPEGWTVNQFEQGSATDLIVSGSEIQNVNGTYKLIDETGFNDTKVWSNDTYKIKYGIGAYWALTNDQSALGNSPFGYHLYFADTGMDTQNSESIPISDNVTWNIGLGTGSITVTLNTV